MSISGIKRSNTPRPTYYMYVSTLTTIRDLSRSYLKASGCLPDELLKLRKFVEFEFKRDYPEKSEGFINLMYNTRTDI